MGALYIHDNRVATVSSVMMSQYEYDLYKDTLPEGTIAYITDAVSDLRDNNKTIKRTTCKGCGADLNIEKVSDNGMCRCEWCRSFNYVW